MARAAAKAKAAKAPAQTADKPKVKRSTYKPEDHTAYIQAREFDTAARETYIKTLAVTGDPIAAYRAAYPVHDDNGTKLSDSTITRRARGLAADKGIVAAVETAKKQIVSAAGTPWTRAEVLDGYRKIYSTAMEYLVSAQYDGGGNVVGQKYNDRAATAAISVLEKITRIYGFDAPIKEDHTVRFVWGNGDTLQTPTEAIAQSGDKPYDYTGEAVERAEATQETPTGSVDGISVVLPAGMSQYTV